MFFPVHRPRVGLSFGLRQATLVRVPPFRPRLLWRRTPFAAGRRDRTASLREGLLRLSDSRPNVAAPREMADLLKGLRGGTTGMLPIALSLPDPCARVALLEFETLPAKRPDLDTLLRWRLQQEYHLSPGPLRLLHRVFRRPDGIGPAGKPFLVLVAAVREDIVAQYIEVCVEAGLYPVRVGLASLQVFDLHHQRLQRALRSRAPSDGARREWFYVYRADWGFALFAFTGPVPQLVRLKAWLTAAEEPTAGAPLLPVDEETLFAEEVLATLQAYLDTSLHEPEAGPRHLFLAGDAAAGFPAGRETGWRPRVEGQGVVVTRLDDLEQVPATLPDGSSQEPPTATRLAALAGVWEA